MLTEALAAQGVEIDVYTTCSGSVKPKRGLAFAWPKDYPGGPSALAGFRVTRFPVNELPGFLGLLAARLLDGHVGMRQPIQELPWLANILMLLGFGPISLPMFRALKRDAPNYDVILVSFVPMLTVPAAVRITAETKRPVVVLPLAQPNDLAGNSPIMARALAQADAILAMTPNAASGKAHDVGGGVDPRLFDDAAISGERFRAKFGLEGRKIALCAGRKEPSRRYRVAMEAIGLVANPEAVLVLAGEDVDKLPVEGDRVRYLGVLSAEDLLDAFDACDVFLLPSRSENFGFTLMEAWARGKPVIGDRECAAVASLIEDSVDGLLSSDAESMARCIERAFSGGARLGAAGRAKVLRRYTWERVAARVKEIYAGLT
jgi:glycosyltransferase involved in cell wall biosynthesis